MTIKNVSVPKYRLHKGSNQAFVQIKGKRHYLGVWGTPKSKERYARFVAELAANPLPTLPSTHSDDESITVVELYAAFHDFAIGYYRKNGERLPGLASWSSTSSPPWLSLNVALYKIQERTKVGLATARVRGRKGGRPRMQPSELKVLLAKRLHGDETIEINDICKTLHILRSTYYRYVTLRQSPQVGHS